VARLHQICEWQTERFSWIDPDVFFDTRNACPFLYNGTLGLRVGDRLDYHAGMAVWGPRSGWYISGEELSGTWHDPVVVRKKLLKKALLGRVGLAYEPPLPRGTKVVSFWNDDELEYDQWLSGCLTTLKSNGIIDDESFVSTPLHGTVPITQIGRGREMDEHERERYELMSRLHLMRGAEKQAAMKKLGVGAGGRPHPVQSAMRGSGLQGPGQRWWAPTSEGRC